MRIVSIETWLENPSWWKATKKTSKWDLSKMRIVDKKGRKRKESRS